MQQFTIGIVASIRAAARRRPPAAIRRDDEREHAMVLWL
jgi:hypothetical protein